MAKKENGFTKTIWQRTETLSEENMTFLWRIAADCAKVKTDVYGRYSGIRQLGSLASVFDIQTAMRHCGLRERLGLPSVYYETAVRDAVADIKSMWGIVKNRIRTCITANDNLSADDRMYIRTVLKLDSLYAAVLGGGKHPMPEKTVGLKLDVKRLDNLLRRLTRRFLVKPETGRADSFCVTAGGYAYKDGQLFLVSGERRRRVAIPLKDQKTTDRQIRVFVREKYADIAIPVESHIKKHDDFRNTLYVHLGYQCMCTLSSGSVYGVQLGKLASARTQRLMEKNRGRGRIRAVHRESAASGSMGKAAVIEENNLGRTKYDRQKKKERARIETYINSELNRMLETEKPAKIVITKPVVAGKKKSEYKPANRMMTESPQGYVRKRLSEKCRMHSVVLEEINSRGTGSVCSRCGSQGERVRGDFRCSSCGYTGTIAWNGAKNIEHKYKSMTSVRTQAKHKGKR